MRETLSVARDPNPAHIAVQVLLRNGASAGPVQLFDSMGTLLLIVPASAAGEATLPLASRPAGLYLVRCGALTQQLRVE